MKKTQNSISSYISPEVETVYAAGSTLICQSDGIDNLDRSDELVNAFEN